MADLTYLRLLTGAFVYAAFVIDAFSRAIVGWAVAATMQPTSPPMPLMPRCPSC